MPSVDISKINYAGQPVSTCNQNMNLKLLDLLFTLLHLLIIGFNLFGWIWKRTRKLHFGFILLTAACWFLLGIWFGIGYCPVTEWQWEIKEKLGEQNLPNSFIKYYADRIFNRNIDAVFIDTITAVCFFAAAVTSICVNFFYKRKRPAAL